MRSGSWEPESATEVTLPTPIPSTRIGEPGASPVASGMNRNRAVRSLNSDPPMSSQTSVPRMAQADTTTATARNLAHFTRRADGIHSDCTAPGSGDFAH